MDTQGEPREDINDLNPWSWGPLVESREKAYFEGFQQISQAFKEQQEQEARFPTWGWVILALAIGGIIFWMVSPVLG